MIERNYCKMAMCTTRQSKKAIIIKGKTHKLAPQYSSPFLDFNETNLPVQIHFEIVYYSPLVLHYIFIVIFDAELGKVILSCRLGSWPSIGKVIGSQPISLHFFDHHVLVRFDFRCRSSCFLLNCSRSLLGCGGC